MKVVVADDDEVESSRESTNALDWDNLLNLQHYIEITGRRIVFDSTSLTHTE